MQAFTCMWARRNVSQAAYDTYSRTLRIRRWLLLGLTLLPVFVVGSVPAVAQSEVTPTLSLPIGPNVTIETVWVAPGEFLQGSPETEVGREADEIQHRVTISQGFYIGKYPITIEQFQSFVNQAKYKTEAERGTSGGFGWNGQELVQSPQYSWKNPGYPSSNNHPVTIVTLEDAQAFCKWLSNKSKMKVQLPTESQWEFACRGGTQERSYAGDTDEQIDEIAWTKANAMGAQPVGGKKPNPLGIFDMCGNVSEWCLDVYSTYPTTSQTDPLATMPDAGEKLRHVLRGGSWNRDRRRARSAARFRSDPKSRNADIGFRIMVMRPESQTNLAELNTKDFDTNADTLAGEAPLPEAFKPQSPTDRESDVLTVPTNSPSQLPAESFMGNLVGVLCCLAIPVIPGIGIFFLVAMLRKNASIPTSNTTSTRGSGRQESLATGANTAFATGVAIGALGEWMDSRCEAFPQGFWFDTTGIPLGSIVRIEYEIDGRVEQYQFEVEHMDRQRVFLGRKPSKVKILGITTPDGNDWRDGEQSTLPNQPPVFDTLPSEELPRTSPSDNNHQRRQGTGTLFGGSRFPSAYS